MRRAAQCQTVVTIEDTKYRQVNNYITVKRVSTLQVYVQCSMVDGSSQWEKAPAGNPLTDRNQI